MTETRDRELAVDFPTKDLPLRSDVRELGALVGEVIKEQAGEELFDRVEGARKMAISRRRGSLPMGLREFLEGLDAQVATELVRAFSLYFRVVNLAETVHRLRRRREHQLAGATAPQAGSLADVFAQLAASLDEAAATALVSGVQLQPVFTAHPTESTRRAVLTKQRRIAARLVERFESTLTPQEQRVNWARIRAEITATWQTEEHPAARPEVADEAAHVLFYLKEVLYPVAPVFFEELESAASGEWGDEIGLALSARTEPLSFSSWVGGDMDGNPNVNAETLASALSLQHRALLELYLRELGSLGETLTQTVPLVEVSEAVLERLSTYASWFPDVLVGTSKRWAKMIYRALLLLMQERLRRTLSHGDFGYVGSDELLGDLQLIEASLLRHKGRHAGRFGLLRTIRRVRTFGFHFASIDVRQDGLVHRRVVGRALDEPHWLDMSAADRHARLAVLLQGSDVPEVPGDEESLETIGVFRAIGECRGRYGQRAVGPVIISMSQDSDDVLSVLLLARMAGLDEGSGQVPLDVAPLFETVPDLQNAAQVMQRLFQEPLYRGHVGQRDDRQIVMVGYSDSNKDGGLLASRWALQRAQGELVDVHRAAAVAMTVFHGRGGTVSRGGGKTHRAVMASPAGSLGGRLRMTEQGETIHTKYGLRGIALRNLERSFGAVALAERAALSGKEASAAGHPWRPVLTQMAATSRRVYRSLVYETPQFIDYFRNATPIDVIERLAIGSRPASRRSGSGIENLRAIPWIFSWTQSRHLLSGWFGLGSALEEAVQLNGIESLQRMVEEWPFVRVLLEDVEMVLAKADLGIAKRYAALAGDTGSRIYPLIEEEFDRTVRWVLALQQASELLSRDPTLRRSIALRNPYVDPMSEIQVDLLGRWRASDRQDAGLLEALFATVRGIAQGLQNTG